MQPYAKAPILAMRLLTHERGRTLASIAGVSLALLLMLVQLGFRNALLDSALVLIRGLDADIIVMSKEKYPFLRRYWMPRERLYRALSVPEVVSVSPVWIGLMHWTNVQTRTLHPIRVIAFDPSRPTFDIDEVNEKAPQLHRLRTALIDEFSRDSYGVIGLGTVEVNLKELEIIGTFPLGTDFEVDGSLLVSEETYFDLRWRRINMVELGLVKVAPHADVGRVVDLMKKVMPGDVDVYAKDDLIRRDRDYWKTGTPVSLMLLVGVALGFAVGVVISYQVLYTEVFDHLAEFATLKAMGYGIHFVEVVVIVEALVLSVFGSIPAIVVGWATVALLGARTGLPASIGYTDALGVLMFSTAMCTLGSLLALRKVRVLDPAELF